MQLGAAARFVCETKMDLRRLWKTRVRETLRG